MISPSIFTGKQIHEKRRTGKLEARNVFVDKEMEEKRYNPESFLQPA